MAAKKAMQSIDRAMERSCVRAALKDLREQILARASEANLLGSPVAFALLCFDFIKDFISSRDYKIYLGCQ